MFPRTARLHTRRHHGIGMVAAIGAMVALIAPGVAAEPSAGQATPYTAALPDSQAADNDIRSRIDTAGGAIIDGQPLHAVLLRQFYWTHDFKPVWPSHQAQANALLNLVLRAGDHGLDPELFHASLLRNPAALSPIERDLVLSDAVLAYADALARGALPVEIRINDEDLSPEPIDVAAAVENAIGSPDPARAIEALAPNSPAYVALQRALQSYRTNNAAVEAAALPAAEDLRARRRSAPEPSTELRLHQIVANLERLRWLPRHLPATRVWVNIASAQLTFYRDDQPSFTTRVVVGQPDWQTPELQTSIESLLYNPPWNVPPSIAIAEILPKLGQDPDYLSRHHMVRRANGSIQQLPGHGTALGYVKFEMPNRFDVYLHDTPMRNMFSRDNRRQSHGCVRVQNPRELAARLLQEPVEAIDRAIALGYTNRRALAAPTPVFLVYQTAIAEANGTVQFHPDIYGRDAEVWQRLHPAHHAPVAQDRESGSQRRG